MDERTSMYACNIVGAWKTCFYLSALLDSAVAIGNNCVVWDLVSNVRYLLFFSAPIVGHKQPPREVHPTPPPPSSVNSHAEIDRRRNDARPRLRFFPIVTRIILISAIHFCPCTQIGIELLQDVNFSLCCSATRIYHNDERLVQAHQSFA